MLDLDTKSPKEAVDFLFEKALPSIDEQTVEQIEAHYDWSFVRQWNSKKLVNGTKTELYNNILKNLEWTSQEIGFSHFRVQYHQPGMWIIAITEADKGASVQIWRAKDCYYLCGNADYIY